MSRIALVLAAVYFAFALGIVVSDSLQAAPSGWIPLQPIASYVVTLPASGPLALLGVEVDLSSGFTAAWMLAAATGVVYGCAPLAARSLKAAF